MTTPVLPDVELIVVEYLRQHADVAALIGTRAYTTLPSSPTWPLLIVRRIGGPPVARSTLDAATVQVEAYANTKADASQVARIAVAAFADAFGFTHAGGYVTETFVRAGLQWIPDPDLNDKPRYLFDLTIYARST